MLTDSQISEKLLEFRGNVFDSLEEITELDISCKSLLQCYLDSNESITSASLIKIQAIIDYMYERINVGNWKEVKLFLRKTITIASYLKLLVYIKRSDEFTDSVLRESFKTIDFGLLFGCPLDKNPKLLQKCAVILNTYNTSCLQTPSTSIAVIKSKQDMLNKDLNQFHAMPIDIINCPSMENFYQNYILTEKPVILENCINHWPALSKWNDENYFIRLAGLRTVSIELGSKYTDSDWTQKLMTIEEFIKNHIYESNGPTGYLAQYQLFEQIPELKNDITEPEYCCFSDNNEPTDVMAWYGPKGTVSPLHHDPKRNLLAQVVGKKQIFLFSPTDSDYLYPHEHELLNNTARVDPRQPDLEKYPKYKNAKAHCCMLTPGQMLFIPPKWWHHVESLSISFSVSFWWE